MFLGFLTYLGGTFFEEGILKINTHQWQKLKNTALNTVR